MKYRVLVCDDQRIARNLFSLIIKESEQFEVIGELATAKRALEFCKTHGVDLVVMDVVMADGSNGLDAAESIKQYSPAIKVVVVTSMPESEYLKRAREIGVDSFWYKEVEEAPILDILERTMAGEKIFPNDAPVLDIGWAKSNEFTDRELEVLRLMTTGATDVEIAQKLNLGLTTVRTHIRHMMEKTGLSRVRLAIEARVHGIAIGNNDDSLG